MQTRSTDFPFQTQFFIICLNFQQLNPLKIQYLSHLKSENCEINSIKSKLSESFLIIPRTHSNSHIILNFDFFFLWENGSIINNFYIIIPNVLKPSQCTPIHWKLSKDTQSARWCALICGISAWQTKQNKLASFINRSRHKVQIVLYPSFWFCFFASVSVDEPALTSVAGWFLSVHGQWYGWYLLPRLRTCCFMSVYGDCCDDVYRPQLSCQGGT